MIILHICSYYVGNKLYSNMFKQMSVDGLKQEVFIPIRNKNQIGVNQIPSNNGKLSFHYKSIIKKSDRYLYHLKIAKQKREIEKSILTDKKIDIVHAHTLYSDGGTAYKLFKKYGIDYIVNIRNTDINWFYKYAIYLRPFMYKVLLNAKSIVFISYAYKNHLLTILPFHIVQKIKGKCKVVPNGIDDYWFQHEPTAPIKYINKKVNLLFIGSLNKNKNLLKVLDTCAILQKKYDVTLDVIGGGPYEKEIFQHTKNLELYSNVNFYGYIKDNNKIMEIMDNSHIFVMPSYKETFGLVYIEAMSRGLPVIYSKRQAIDGFFKEGEVGFSVKPDNEIEIAENVEKILLNYYDMSQHAIDKVRYFTWSENSRKYIQIYKN